MILYNSHISPSFSKERFTSEKNGTGRYVSDRKHNNLSFLCFKKLCMSNFCVTHTHTHSSHRAYYTIYFLNIKETTISFLFHTHPTTLYFQNYIYPS